MLDLFLTCFLYLCFYLKVFNSIVPSFDTFFFPGLYARKSVPIWDLNPTNISIYNDTYSCFKWTKIVESKYFIEWANYTNSYHILCPNNATEAMYFFPSVLAREYSRFVHIENAYCTPGRGIAAPRYMIHLYNIRRWVNIKKTFVAHA